MVMGREQKGGLRIESSLGFKTQPCSKIDVGDLDPKAPYLQTRRSRAVPTALLPLQPEQLSSSPYLLYTVVPLVKVRL
jgi:hypothetical protein